MQVLEAKDGSKNFIWDYGLGRALEARNIFTDMMPQSKVQVIQRVGLEAKASCGMFVS